MKIIYNKIIPFGKRYKCINLFGVLFSKSQYITDRIINHENIHTVQMKELLYIPFYILYGLEWIFRVIQYLSFVKGYHNISFEREAFTNQENYNYLDIRKHYSFIKYYKK